MPNEDPVAPTGNDDLLAAQRRIEVLESAGLDDPVPDVVFGVRTVLDAPKQGRGDCQR